MKRVIAREHRGIENSSLRRDIWNRFQMLDLLVANENTDDERDFQGNLCEFFLFFFAVINSMSKLLAADLPSGVTHKDIDIFREVQRKAKSVRNVFVEKIR